MAFPQLTNIPWRPDWLSITQTGSGGSQQSLVSTSVNVNGVIVRALSVSNYDRVRVLGPAPGFTPLMVFNTNALDGSHFQAIEGGLFPFYVPPGGQIIADEPASGTKRATCVYEVL